MTTTITMYTEDRNAILNILNLEVERIERRMAGARKLAEDYALTHPDNTKSFEDNEQHYLCHIAVPSYTVYDEKKVEVQRLIDVMYQ